MTRARDQNVVSMQTDWPGYSRVLELVGDRPVRVTYDRGRLEIVSPGRKHEKRKSALRMILETLMVLSGLDYENGGSMTFRREDLDRGLEPDECYWIQHCLEMRSRDQFEASTDPPPDLAVEIEVTSSAIHRMDIYAALGVPEVWRLTEDAHLEVHRLTAPQGYELVASSTLLPWLRPATVLHFLQLSNSLTKPELLRHIDQWMQSGRAL